MPDWREKVLNTGLLLGVICGLIAYVPNVSLAADAGLMLIVVADTLTLLLAVALFFARGVGFAIRARFFLLLFYGLGCALLANAATLTDVYFLTFAGLTAIFLGFPAGCVAVALSTVTLVVCGYTFDAAVHLAPHQENSVEKWLIIGTNYFLLSSILVGCLSVLVRGLEYALGQEHEARDRATADHQALKLLHTTLQEEMAARHDAETQHARLILAAEQAAEIVLVFDSAGRPEYANSAYARVTGFPPSLDHVLTLDALDAAAQARGESFRESLHKGETWRGRIRIQNCAGALVDVEASLRPVLDAAGEVINYVGIVRDVTKEVELEARLRQAQKLEAIGTLAGGIAHDFNNILLSLVSQADLLRDELAHQASEESRHRVEEIARGCLRAKLLVQQILTFSRQMELHRQPVRLHDTIDEILPLLRASVPSTIEIRTRLVCPEAVVFSDPIQLHQVVLNLCTNAVHAMESLGGLLQIEVSACEQKDALAETLGLDPELQHVCLAVRDTGTGIEPALLDRIFDPFFTTKPRGKGTGLGLATVHGIVTRMEGAIRVLSEPGQGTTFLIYLPLADASIDKPAPVAAELISKGGGECILLLDDEPTILSVGAQVLQRLGYVVVPFSDSVQAWAHLEANAASVDVVITDQTMPQLTGLQLAKRLLERHPGLPVLITSGYSTQLTDEALNLPNIAGFLQKPYSRNELSRQIQIALAKRVGAQPAPSDPALCGP